MVRGRVKKVEGNKRYTFPVIRSVSCGDVMYSIGNIVNNIVINFVQCQMVTKFIVVTTSLGI